LSDIFSYNITKNTIGLYRDYSHSGGPHPGFAHPSNIDPERQEIYVMSGMTREKGSATSSVKNMVWVYNIEQDIWTEVYHNDNLDAEYWSQMSDREPHPRFAHQMVYDPNTKTHFMFGGNPSNSVEEKRRLEDLWELKLTRGEDGDILRQAKLMIRKHYFKELCVNKKSSMEALAYLQGPIAELVDHDSINERNEFHMLASTIFNGKLGDETTFGHPGFSQSLDATFNSRIQLYESLIAFFPESMKQPSGNLIELIRLK